MIAAARRVALDALSSVSAGVDLPDALARTRERLTDDRDRALAATIVIGTLRWRARLDYHLQPASARRLESLDAVVLETLRLSLYQLLYLDRVPAAAVVDDAVSLVRRRGKSSAGAFVNGVLRTLSRTRHELALPEIPSSIDDAGARQRAVDALAITGSHPRWLVARWLDRLGLETTRRWIEFNNIEAPLTLRVNTRRAPRGAVAARLGSLGVTTARTRFAPDGLTVTDGNLMRTPLVSEGDLLLQDEASQLVPLAAGVRPGDRVLDACAAPGGKSLILADALKDRGLLVAADRRRSRIALLQQVTRTFDANIRLVEHDLEAGVPFGPVFDRVLIDAPCTGLGTLRRDVDIRWRRDASDISQASSRQLRMLENGASAVARTGRLVYATCSSEPEENEQVVASFLALHPEFRRVPPSTLEAGGLAASLLDPVTGDLRTSPDRHGLECFYAAALERA